VSGRPGFALVPRRGFTGTRFGAHRSQLRGDGDEVASLRPYRPGDRRTTVDWRATARVASARGDDAFLVREYFANRAPTVALVVDRRPAMSLYPPGLPWLDKAQALDEVTRQVAAATSSEGGELTYLEHGDRRPRRLRATHVPTLLRALERRPRPEAFTAPENSLLASLHALAAHAAGLPAGTFVFVVSDFLPSPPPRVWARLRGLRWDVTPVIVQDPVWEQSFPPIGGVTLDVADPATGHRTPVRLRRREAERRASANASRLERAVAEMRGLGLDPVLVGSAEPAAVAASFRLWARRRRALRRRSA
jgi:uncharacterized protein (DUF58 family)